MWVIGMVGFGCCCCRWGRRPWIWWRIRQRSHRQPRQVEVLVLWQVVMVEVVVGLMAVEVVERAFVAAAVACNFGRVVDVGGFLLEM